jgi:hypothetical protein
MIFDVTYATYISHQMTQNVTIFSCFLTTKDPYLTLLHIIYGLFLSTQFVNFWYMGVRGCKRPSSLTVLKIKENARQRPLIQ